MTTDAITKISLSTEEMALVYSLLSLPASGKSLLFDMYGELQPSTIEEKLVTASHSLMARGMVTLSEKATVILHDQVAEIFTPLVIFKNKLQVLINDQGRDEDPIVRVTDYYLGNKGFFTSHEIDMGVIHHLFHGEIPSLAEFILGGLKFPSEVSKNIDTTLSGKSVTLKMADYPALEEMGKTKASETLISNSFDPSITEALSEAISEPLRRGSVIMVNVSSETLESKDFSETGAGFFWLIGEKSSWIMSFENTNEDTVANILPGTIQVADKLLREMLA